MNKKICLTIISVLIFMILGLSWKLYGPLQDVHCSNQDSQALAAQRYELAKGKQISARYINKVAKLEACMAPDDIYKQKIHTIIQDLEIKASSYALINKVFFGISIVLALCIILFPVLNLSLKTDNKIHKIFSPSLLPSMVVLAGLCFSLNADYKVKQTSTENLMRYAYFSEKKDPECRKDIKCVDGIGEISKKIREALAQIDSGYDFSNVVK